jgi:anti-sigma B factor antagonist
MEVGMDFTIRTTMMGGVDAVWIAVEGELDLATAPQAREATEVAAQVSSPLVLDLSECSFLDSAGLRAVLYAYELMAAVKRTMVIVGAHPQVSAMLALTGFDVHIRVFPTRPEALAWLKREEAAAPLAPQASPDLQAKGRRPPAASPLP